MAGSEQARLKLRKLAEALQTLKEAAAENETRMARDSLLLRFIYTFEMGWQCMHQMLRERGDDETEKIAFAVLATAFKIGWLADGGLWKRIREARNAVSHSYDESVAIALAAFVRQLALPEFERLLTLLEAQA